MNGSSSLRIIVTGLIAQHPSLGGVTWDYLQYPLGLAQLGHDVYYFEDSGEWPYKHDGGPSGDNWIARDCTTNVEHLAETMARFGLEDRWAYRFPIDSRWYGLASRRRREIIDSADLLINVSGTLHHPEEYQGVKRLVYIDSDPGFTQIKLIDPEQESFRARVDQHDVHFSFGANIGPALPESGQRWRPTRQPVLLSAWHPGRARRAAYTTVMSWTSYKPLRYDGKLFAQKDIELKRFAALPKRLPGVELELAMNQTHHAEWETAGFPVSDFAPADDRACSQGRTPAALLAALGWHVVDAAAAGASLDSYRDYIETSKAEWSVAKSGYVVGRTGWFSCRSACYLAAGRPVVVQDTGFGTVLPSGEGILAFSDIDGAAAAIRRIDADYDRHAATARSIAETYFDSDKVLTRLIEEAFSSD